ncbi:MAG: hypothetical protein ACKPHU_35335, partial [Planctomycetaceae bacterium]
HDAAIVPSALATLAILPVTATGQAAKDRGTNQNLPKKTPSSASKKRRYSGIFCRNSNTARPRQPPQKPHRRDNTAFLTLSRESSATPEIIQVAGSSGVVSQEVWLI